MKRIVVPVVLLVVVLLAHAQFGPPPATVSGVPQDFNRSTFNSVVVNNQLQFSTNAFPLSPGTTWNLSRNYQRILTNNDWNITAIGGLSNNVLNWGMIEWSNSDSATHFCDMSTIPWHFVGSATTNKVYLGSGKVAIISANIPGMVSSNLVTAVQP